MKIVHEFNTSIHCRIRTEIQSNSGRLLGSLDIHLDISDIKIFCIVL